jgi:hypothetical protein
MFSLNSREQFLVAGIIAAAVVGAAVSHWRDARREVPARIAPPDLPYARPVAAGSGAAIQH